MEVANDAKYKDALEAAKEIICAFVMVVVVNAKWMDVEIPP